MIECTAEWIRTKITSDVKESKFFLVMADEAQDASNQEQLPLILRCSDRGGQLRGDFMGFLPCDEGVTGDATSNLILDAFQKCGLDMQFCRGQCYDGAGSMAVKTNRVAARIKREYPQAVYVHCQSHRVSLAVVDACKIQRVRNAMGTLVEAGLFFSPHKESARAST